MFTDIPPRRTNRSGFLESDRIQTLDLPPDGRLPLVTKSIASAIVTGASRDIHRACEEFLDAASKFYKVPACRVRVLAARPLRVRERWTTELFGDYTPDTMLIRVWMRTAGRKDVTSFGTFLSTLCHEFAIISIFKSSDFPIPGTHAASMNAPEGFTTAYAELRPSVCSGRRCAATAGGSTGHGPIAVDESVRGPNGGL